MSKHTITLSNGTEVPLMGFGCAYGNWSDTSSRIGFTPEDAWVAVPQALHAGYRLLDCALLYGTHNIVGHCIGSELREHRLTRKELFVSSKIVHAPVPIASNTLGVSLDIAKYLADPTLDIKPRIVHDYERSLAELNLGYLDLLLVHWPGLFGSQDKGNNVRVRRDIWTAFEDLYLDGKVRAIGVSNFAIHHLESIFPESRVKPMINQIEISPYNQQKDVVKFCQENSIALQSWGPFGSGATGVLKDPVIAEIAAAHKKNVGQVIVRWLVQQGIAVLPKSSSPERLKSNLDVFDFALTEEDMRRIGELDRGLSSVPADPRDIA